MKYLKKKQNCLHYIIHKFRDSRVKELLNQAGKAIAEIEKLDGFRSIDLNLENHDLSANVIWDDGSITTIL